MLREIRKTMREDATHEERMWKMSRRNVINQTWRIVRIKWNNARAKMSYKSLIHTDNSNTTS